MSGEERTTQLFRGVRSTLKLGLFSLTSRWRTVCASRAVLHVTKAATVSRSREPRLVLPGQMVVRSHVTHQQ